MKGFSEYVCDRRYPWTVICEREFGRAPGQLFDERNLVAHLDEFEGDPRRRPLTVDELDAFFAACDERITRASASGRKGTLQAWRDQAMFKIAFGWGLRRRELAMLDVCDFRPDARLPEFGGYAQVHVRHGKSKRGGGPQRRTVLTVFAWAVEVVEQYVAEIRPCFGAPRHPAMFLTERGTRIALASINERFAEIRADAGPGRAADTALPAPQLRDASGRAGVGGEVHSGPGRPQPRRHDGGLHVGRGRLQGPARARRDRRATHPTQADAMTVDYEWRLRLLMAEHGMFKATDLQPRLAEHGIELSASQVWRLVTGRPERLNLRVLVVLCEILDCEPGELVRRTDAAAPAIKEPATGRTIDKDLRPRRVQLKRPANGA